jgi:hypothetical protein
MAEAVLERVDHQIRWYDRHATTARIWYCSIKIAQIVLAAAVPVAAGLDLPTLLTGSLGGLIVVLEGIQQLYRFHDNWVRYRWTASAMERERSLWTARAGDYATADRPDARLALRIEDLTSREATQWVALQQARSTATGSAAEAAPNDDTNAPPGTASTPTGSDTAVGPDVPAPARQADEAAPTTGTRAVR